MPHSTHILFSSVAKGLGQTLASVAAVDMIQKEKTVKLRLIILIILKVCFKVKHV